jgi:hypothetical protein
MLAVPDGLHGARPQRFAAPTQRRAVSFRRGGRRLVDRRNSATPRSAARILLHPKRTQNAPSRPPGPAHNGAKTIRFAGDFCSLVIQDANLGSLAHQRRAVLRTTVFQSWKIVQHTGLGEWFQSNFKLARQFGVMNLVVLHKLADLQAAGDAGSRAARIAEGLIADASTRVVYHQDESQVPLTRALLGLSETEARLISMLSAGQALWRVGSRSFVVQHYRSRLEAEMTNTDTGMRISSSELVRG